MMLSRNKFTASHTVLGTQAGTVHRSFLAKGFSVLPCFQPKDGLPDDAFYPIPGLLNLSLPAASVTAVPPTGFTSSVGCH